VVTPWDKEKKIFRIPRPFAALKQFFFAALLFFRCLQVQAYNQKASILEGLGQTHDALHQLHLSLEYLPGSALCKLHEISQEVISFGSVSK